jgi:hypothetical protein
MKIAISAAVLAATLLFAPVPANAASIADLQHLLNNAGYNAGPATGEWSESTANAATEFAAHYGLDVGALTAAPNESALETLVTDGDAKLDAEYAAFPTQKLPDHYFVALGDANYWSITEWSQRALVVHDGKQGSVPITRFYQPIDEDIPQFKAAGVPVIRMQLGMDGALFFKECDYHSSRGADGLDACFARNYAAAREAKWVKQTELLSHIADNPVVQLYMDSAQKWIEEGFHVIVVPTDFYNGIGSHFDGSDDPNADNTPLLHRALMSDAVFREFFAHFSAVLVGEFKKRNLTNFSLQSANEPRFCSDRTHAQPKKGELANWQALERTQFDAVRKVAPRLSLISTAICTASVSYFDAGRPYTDLRNVMPLHEGIDDVTYALHLYSPGAIFGADAANDRFKPGTVIHYPYQKLAASSALNEGARHSVSLYNKLKVGPKFFDRIFADIGAWAKERGVRIMLTETGIPKPNFGIPREDRIRALGDIVAASRRADVAVTYFDVAGSWGLSSCDMNSKVPDHRFDPGVMNVLASGNNVAGIDPKAALPLLESLCGKRGNFQTNILEESPPAVRIEAIFSTSEGKGPAVKYNLLGTYFPLKENFLSSYEITVIEPSFGKTAPDGIQACGAQLKQFDGKQHLAIKYVISDSVVAPQGADCLLKLVPKNMQAAVHMLTDQFPDVATDFVASGKVEAVANQYLRDWFSDLAEGTVTVAATP